MEAERGARLVCLRKRFMVPEALKEAFTVTLLLISFGGAMLRCSALPHVYSISSNVVFTIIAGDSNAPRGVMASFPSLNNDSTHDSHGRHEYQNGYSQSHKENPMPVAPGAVPVTV